MNHAQRELETLYRQLVANGSIKLDARQGQITDSDLNPNENNSLLPGVVHRIAALMYEEIENQGFLFDSIAGVPSGGTAYATAIAEIIEAKEARQVPVMSFMRDGKFPAFIIGSWESRQVLIVDETLVHGETFTTTAALLRKHGHRVVGAAFAANYERMGDFLVQKTLQRHTNHAVAASVFTSTRSRTIFAHEYEMARRRRYASA